MAQLLSLFILFLWVGCLALLFKRTKELRFRIREIEDKLLKIEDRVFTVRG